MLVGVAGEVVTLAPATDLSWRQVQAAATDILFFGSIVWPAEVRIPMSRLDKVQRAWVAHNALPEAQQVHRLAYMMEKYSKGIEYDLRAKLNVSARELWQDREWRILLDYIDHLPTDTHLHRLLSQDDEYMEQALKAKSSPDAGRPSMADWSQTNSMLAVLIDAVNRNTAVTQAVAGGKGPKPQVHPYPRPATAAERIQYKMQKARHQEMVSTLLPRKSQVS